MRLKTDSRGRLSLRNRRKLPYENTPLSLLFCVLNFCVYGQSRTPVPTNIERANGACSQFVSTFKRFCNKEYGENIWQARFYGHVIRNREDYEEHVKYIYENPMRWYYDELYTEE